MLSGIAGSSPAGGMEVGLVCVLFSQVEVSALGRSLIQRSPTDFGVPLCDLDTPKMSRSVSH